MVSPDGSLRIYFSMGHQQGMTRAMSPLGLSIFPIMLPIGRAPDGLSNPYLRPAGGRMFVDITPLLRHPFLRRVVFALLAQFDALAPAMLQEAMRRPGFRRARPAHLSWGFVRFAAAMARRVLAALWLRDLTGFVTRTNALHDEFVAQVRQRLQNSPSGKARLEASAAILRDLFSFFVHWVPEAAAGVAAARLLPRLARRYLPADQAETLALGIPGNVVNEMNLALDDLAALARQIPSLRDHFTRLGEDAHAWLEQAAALEGTRPFLDALEAFLDRYGVRGPGEIDIARPRWRENPAPLLQVLAAHVLGPAHSQRAQWDQMVRQREAAYQALLQTAGRGPFGWARRWLFRLLYHVATQTGGMREHHKFLAVRVLAEIKEALKATAADLVARGVLRQADDIWFLTWKELLRLETIPSTPPWKENMNAAEGRADSEEDWDALIARRRADMKRFQRLTPPIVITSEGETPVVRHRRANVPPGALVGQPVSSGVVEGVARVVHDPQRERLVPGEILVAEFTDPGWTPLFINAAGLVLEVGGSLTYGAVVAREYGIPAVVGVREATKKIHTGQRIRVDGNRGFVEVLAPLPAPSGGGKGEEGEPGD